MIIYNSYNTGPFVYCNYYQGPGETTTYYNDGHGHYHQWLYLESGQALAEIRDVEDTSTPPAETDDKPVGSLVRLSRARYITTITTDKHASMMLFNPVPADTELSIDIIKTAETRTVTATDKRITLVCITGPVTANGVSLESMQHAKIFPGKTVELVVPENSVCALVS